MADPKTVLASARLDFLVIGAEKSGTTWLADRLRQHPRIFLPPEKEIFYFNRRFFESPELENFNHRKPLEWYFSFFKDARPGQLIGEICPAYLWDESAPEAIQLTAPQVKLIALLRDPVGRSVSQYRYYIQRGVLGEISFDEAARLRPDILSRSLYAVQLNRYFERFPASQILIAFYDDLLADNRAFLTRIESFLGVEPHIPAGLTQRSNVTGVPRFPALNRAIARLRYLVRKYDPPFLLDLLRWSGLARLSERLRLLNTRPEEPPQPLGAEAEARLRAFFRPDVEELERIAGRDLSAWK